jgi:hypothetical protein
MTDAEYDKVQSELKKAIKKGESITFEEPIPVSVTLDNGVQYKGVVYEVQSKSDHFPEGLVMVRTATSDLGVPLAYIKGR